MGSLRKSLILMVSSSGLAGVVGCAGFTQLTPSGAPQPPREKNCEFLMLTAPPVGSFVEVGTVDVQSTSSATDLHKNLGFFKEIIRADVCKAGGDAAIAYANGAGQYMKASVVKLAPVAARADAAPPAAAAGCQYDTQCKADRVCIKGECVSPDAPPAPATTP